jgi:hypothetical protein
MDGDRRGGCIVIGVIIAVVVAILIIGIVMFAQNRFGTKRIK